MAKVNVTVNIQPRAMHRLRVGLAATSRAIECTDRAAAAHERGDESAARVWLLVREHYRRLAGRSGLHAGGMLRRAVGR